ncbi:Myosin heavy chain, non-muscle [Talaromyces islandicus]|uniref:Myosin heavy chain, non-muscle n=1 Tax=Talaromyces islandicus TaxID=28573 RepID=A0A0U1MAA7_TALIS|nr:Myosin heavy chain, non-muscle [Talaromyces islandicus]
MASSDSEGSHQNMDHTLKGQQHQSNPELGKLLTVPMYVTSAFGQPPRWDSSDPERAPPPLPLNPGTGSPKTRASASPGIQAATASLAEKMRENAPSAYTTNPMPTKSSPDKSLVKGMHRRMQSMQPASDARTEFRNYLENKTPERRTQTSTFEAGERSPEKSPIRTSTSLSHDSGRDSPSSSLYVSSRYLMKPLLGESTPPSATMRAIQNMQLPGDDLKALQASPATKSSANTSFDGISEQIQSLTAIATSLQKEMSQLSRRSKDNATDLLSLKAATNSRDEDIRKSIRDLATNLSSKLFDTDSASTRSATFASTRSGYSIDSKPFDSSPSSRKSYTLPRIPSPGSFAAAFEKDLSGSPAPVSDGSASIALLEKVLREMATKEAQEKLLELVDEVKKRPAKEGSDKGADQTVTKMLEEILNLVKENPTARALVRSSPQRSEERPTVERTRSGPIVLGYNSSTDLQPTGQTSVTSEDIMDLLRRVKNSVAEGGGLTNEVKALVRELRGEVLGMGREIGRKLDEAAAAKSDENNERPLAADEVAEIVQSGLAELKQQMESMIHDHGRSISTSITAANSDPSKVYSAVRSAFEEFPQPQQLVADCTTDGMKKEDILDAVREAWETYKPEIELQNFGLEREEILECLNQGLKDYQPQNRESVTYDQVLAAVQAGMQSFIPPSVEAPPGITRDEIAAAVKECLESFELTIPEPNFTKDDVFAAVQDAISGQKQLTENDSPANITREDVFEAVLDAMSHRESSDPTTGITREDVLGAVIEAMEGQRSRSEVEPSISREDVFEAVMEAIGQQNIPREEPSSNSSNITRDDIYSAVMEAMGGQQRALPPDESTPAPNAEINRQDIFEAVTDSLAAYHTAAKEAGESNISREDIYAAVSEALASHPNSSGITREDVLSAIAEGLTSQNAVTREIELNKDDLFDAVTSGLQEAAASSNFNVGEQVLERLGELVQGMKDEFKQYSAANGKDTEQVLDAMKDGLQDLRGEIESYVDRASDVTGKEEIIVTVKEGFRLLQADLENTINEAAARSSSPRGNPDTPELLDAMEKEFEHLRSTLSTLLVRNEGSGDKDEIIDAIHEMNSTKTPEVDTSNIVQAVRDEFENIRESISMSVVKSGPTDKDEIIAALQESFENLQAETGQKRDGNESDLSNTSELLEAFNDGIDTIRADLDRLLSKSDEQGSAQILDVLQEGLGSIRQEMEALREAQKEFEETSTVRGRELMLSNENSMGGDIEGLKALITQLQIKVEAIESNPPPAPNPEDSLKREHLDEVLAAVREVHGSVAEVSTRDIPVDPDTVRKTDTDAIEALVRDTAARIENIDLSSSQDLAKSEQMVALEALVSELKDAVAEVSMRLETEGPTKSEIGTLETLLKDLWVAVDDIKNPTKDSEEGSEPVMKSDLQTVEAMIFDVKTSVEELKLPDVETLPTKSEIEELSTLITSFKERVESEAELTAQAFEARKVEHGGLAEKIDEAKLVVADLREELKTKLDGSHEGLSELKTLLEGLAIASETFTTVESIKEINELISREFERARGEQETNKLETEERDAAALIKQDETRAAVVADIGSKMDEKIGEILSKYDELQTSIDAKFSESESRDMANTEHMTNTKSIAEDIKLVIGAMGNSVTEACERMGDDAKTIFNKVHESYSKMEAMHTEIKEQGDLSKAGLEKTSAATDRVENQILEYHPQILSSIKDIFEIVSQHYMHSQQTSEELKANLSAIPSAIPNLLPALPAPPEPREIIVPEKYDDKELHSKLDLIMGHTENASKTMSSMDKLDEIHAQVMGTSREITEMVASQSRLVVEDYERKKRETEEAGYALEKRLAQKEKVETEILNLTEEKESLLRMIQSLKHEKEDLTQQNMRTRNELSGLATALELRQREMELFEERAQGLEKRILAGVFDHARTMILKETGRNKNGMSLKRVSSYASTATKTSRASITSTAKDARGLVSNGVEMALKRRTPAKPPSRDGSIAPSSVGKERRILSLSNVTGNRGSVDRQVTAPVGAGGLTNLKRSHSVRSNLPSRKTSWTPRDYSANKENESFPEEEEQHSDVESDTGTERRTSYSGTYTDSMSYGTGSTVSGNRQASFASSINGLVADHGGSILEEDDEEEHEAHESELSESESEHSDNHEEHDPDDVEDYQTTVDEQENHTDVGDLSDLEPPPGFKHPGPVDSGIGSDIHKPLSVS